MALPAALTGHWNPFRVRGTAMPPNLLLLCKVLAVALLATGHVRILPDPDRQRGLFFVYWAGRVNTPVYRAAADAVSADCARCVMCWASIVGEFAVAVGVVLPPLVPLALWVNALFQFGLLQFTVETF